MIKTHLQIHARRVSTTRERPASTSPAVRFFSNVAMILEYFSNSYVKRHRRILPAEDPVYFGSLLLLHGLDLSDYHGILHLPLAASPHGATNFSAICVSIILPVHHPLYGAHISS